MDSLVLDTIIGIVFVFAVFGLLVSSITEAVARFMGLRGEYLMRGLRSLLDERRDFKLRWRDLLPRRAPDRPSVKVQDSRPLLTKDESVTTQLLSKTFLTGFADHGSMPESAGQKVLSNAERRALPSYIGAASFSQAVVDLIIPDQDGATSMDTIRSAVATMPPGPLRQFLDSLARSVQGDVAEFRRGIEQWYDDQMARVSGWYKRHIRWITLALGVILVLAFNVNAVTVARALYSDEALRESVVTQAIAAADCTDKEPDECLNQTRDQISESVTAGLPIGWGPAQACDRPDVTCNDLDRWGITDPFHSDAADLYAALLTLLGWAIMVFALIPGSRFWFDLLSRLGSLRSSGPKPDE